MATRKGPIPVLLVLDGQEPLRESALAARESRAPAMDIRLASLPRGATIDPSFTAVPIGPAKPGAVSLDAVHPANSEKFVVRAFAETTDGKIPETIDGAAVFSQPRIEPLLTCINSPPVERLGRSLRH
jgi:hypothetical protein